jgi:hypothetical protein
MDMKWIHLSALFLITKHVAIIPFLQQQITDSLTIPLEVSDFKTMDLEGESRHVPWDHHLRAFEARSSMKATGTLL